MLMGKTFTWLDFIEESEADLQAYLENMLEEEMTLRSPSKNCMDRIQTFMESYEALDIKRFGIAEFYKN